MFGLQLVDFVLCEIVMRVRFVDPPPWATTSPRQVMVILVGRGCAVPCKPHHNFLWLQSLLSGQCGSDEPEACNRGPVDGGSWILDWWLFGKQVHSSFYNRGLQCFGHHVTLRV